MGTLKLFDDEQNDDDVSKIAINKEYAKRFEHNKKREELQRYEELKKKGVIEESDSESDNESSSESEEGDDGLIGSSKKDLEFIKALLLVKKKDPSVKEKDVKLFESESEGSDDEQEEESEIEEGKKKNKKAMYLKDVMAKHLIEEGPEFEDKKGEEFREKKTKKKSYNEEQEEIKKAFLDAVKEAEANDDKDDGGFLKEKRKENDEDGDFEDDNNEEFVKKLDEYFGGDGELDDNKMFLKEFFKNKMWIDKEKKNKEADIDEEVEDLLREDEELERQEQYEINFRHEEGVDDRVMGHSRKVEGSVRKKDNARKEQRKSKEERMKIAEMERKEELKHLKNLKKKEMKERMKKVMAIAGFKEEEDLPLNLKDLDDDFDPEEYDRMMKSVFDAKYYDAEDVDPVFGKDGEEDEGEIEKPDFDKDDELLGLPKGWDVIESGDGFKAARERILKHKLENVGDDGNEGEREGEEGEEETGEVYEESKRKRKRKMSLVKRAKEEMLEEFYKLDYEDTVGDLKTRFKYAKVKPNRYGFKTEEILMMDDKELNQYVSVKKIAPYREKEWKVPDGMRYQLKLRNKELSQGQKSDNWKNGKKKRSRDDGEKSTSEMSANGDDMAQLEEPNGDAGNLSKRAKTRRRQAKPKLSHSRLVAYGKIPSKGRSKN